MVLMLSLLLAAMPQTPTGNSSADAAFAVLQKDCARCHGDTGSAKNYMLLDRAAMVKAEKVLPGNAADSILYKRITGAAQPLMPAGGTKLRDEEIAVIRRWIDDGAPDWRVPTADHRPIRSNDETLSTIEKDLASADSGNNRRFYRYFLLTNLYNAGNAKLANYRSALSKLMNSLSWDKDIVLPRIIDQEQTVLRIDLRDYDWTDPAGTWETITAGYPYGVEFSGSTFARIQTMTSSQIPFIRADWFLAAASMPPLYHEILELPSNETDLEICGRGARRCLHIDTQRNLQDAAGLRVVRAGITDSGVSNSNRVVERHRSSYGAYWKSHDFPDNLDDHNIFQHPLDFQRAGGELIFNLPNGLQAYLLVNDRGERLDQAPTNIVFNKGGSRAEIRNGLSCMSCHANGMRSLTDDVRATLSGLPADDRWYAAELYPESSVLKKLLSEDQQRFETALRKAGVLPGVEPIGELSERYGASLDADTAAAELGVTQAEFLRRLSQSDYLRQLGLGNLLSDGTVKRDAWEDVFGAAVEEFHTGTWIEPTRVYGERFFSSSPITQRSRRPIALKLSEQSPSILSAAVGKPVRTVQDGKERNYSIRGIRFTTACSLEVEDVTRLTLPNNPSQWWLEEDAQSFSLALVRLSVDEGTVTRLSVKSDTPTIRLARSISSSNRWNDASLPRPGNTVEFVRDLIFDLPPGPETDRVVQSLRNSIADCSR